MVAQTFVFCVAIVLTVVYPFTAACFYALTPKRE